MKKSAPVRCTVGYTRGSLKSSPTKDLGQLRLDRRAEEKGLGKGCKKKRKWPIQNSNLYPSKRGFTDVSIHLQITTRFITPGPTCSRRQYGNGPRDLTTHSCTYIPLPTVTHARHKAHVRKQHLLLHPSTFNQPLSCLIQNITCAVTLFTPELPYSNQNYLTSIPTVLTTLSTQHMCFHSNCLPLKILGVRKSKASGKSFSTSHFVSSRTGPPNISSSSPVKSFLALPLRQAR